MSEIDRSFLTPKCRDFAEKVPSQSDSTIEEMRAECVAPTDKLPHINYNVEKIEIKASKDGHPIPVHIYRTNNSSETDILPAIVYLHGGGFCLPGDEGHKYLAQKLADDAKCAVLYVLYSLSPEVKLPVASEETYDVVKFATDPKYAKIINVDPTRIAIGGDSAGGNLSAGVCLLAKQKNELKNSLKLQILYYPRLNDNYQSESFKKYGKGFFINEETCRFFESQYKVPGTETSIILDPGKATVEDLVGLPPAVIVVGQADILCSEGEEYGRKLLKAGVPTTSIRINGVIHGFLSIPDLFSDQTLTAIDIGSSSLRRVFNKTN